jgi:hypothetical protein
MCAILDYHIEQGEVPDAAQLTAAPNHAGVFNLAVNAHQHWSYDTLAWARAQGCTSPLLNYADYLSDDDHYYEYDE